jgi:HPt (histidine-containing phosphotransfer) domain-containing protein
MLELLGYREVLVPGHVPSRSAPLDHKTLGSLRALQRGGNPDLLAQVVQSYCDSAPRLLHTLRAAVSQGDAPAIQRTAHRLKSSSGNVGALTLVALCKDLAALGGANHTASATDILSAIEAEYQAVQDALEAEVQGSECSSFSQLTCAACLPRW